MRATAVTALLCRCGERRLKLTSNAPTSKIKTFAFVGNMAQTSMTREACATLCYTFNFPSSDCNEPCTGASTEMCGAANRMNINPGKLFRQTPTKELPVCNTSLSIGARLDDLIGRLSLEEKAGLIGPDPVTSPCAFLDYGVKRLDIPPYLHLVETNTAVASACIISQDTCATHLHWPHRSWRSRQPRVISTEMRAFNNLNWHRGSGVLQKITHRCGLHRVLLIGEYAAADVTDCQDGPDKKYKKMAAGLRHFDAHSVETNRMAFNGNISTFVLWDTETLNRAGDMELGETYFTTNGYLEQDVKQDRTTIDTVHNTVRWVLKDSFIMGKWHRGVPHLYTLTSSNGRCISKCPNGEYELGNGCAECHSTRVPTVHCPLPPPPVYYAKDHRCVPCTTCGMGTWTSTPCSASSHAVCSSWTECKPAQKESVSGNVYQPLPDRASCFSTSMCEEPFIETIPPTLTTDRLCSCDTLTCNKLITQLFEEMVCAEPMDEQLDVVLDVCCSGQGEDGIRDTIRQMDAYEARHSCPGCTDTCECSAGFILVYDADSADCRPCNGVTVFSPSIGGIKCAPLATTRRRAPTAPAPASPAAQAPTTTTATLPPTCMDVTECAPGFEEVQTMTLIIGDRVCDEKLEGTHKAVSGQGVPCLPIITTYDAGEEETAEPTPTSDRVCSLCELDATFKSVDGQAESCRPSTFPRMAVSKCEFGTFQSQVPTLDSDRECTLECSGCSSDRYEIRACSALEDVHATRRRSASAPPVPPHLQVRPWRAARIRAPTSTSDTKCEPCPIGTTDHDRNPLTACQPCPLRPLCACRPHRLLRAVPVPGRHRRLGSQRQHTLCTPCQAGVDFAALSGQRDCTLVTECNLGFEEVVRPAMRPTIFTDRQCRRCIEGLFYRNSNTGFCMRVCRPASLARLRRPRPPSARTASARWARICPNNNTFISRPLMPTQNRICSPWTQCLSSEYELVAPSLVNDRECQRVRSCQDTEYEGTIIATVASINEDLMARLFNRSVSGDITVMAFTASPCEADAFLDDSSLWLHGNHLKASDAVGSWTITALNSKEVAIVFLVDHRQSSVAVRHAVFDDASLLLLLPLRLLFVDTHAYIGDRVKT
ncbi:hypothetical protein PTSG_09687 [Salpingoeca rosetta]|uniref:TNFR-Cys domain-containing protein n=1 Tax=Salpingoeca rosetta (strain ATCC 50818 / BSB-021) TaxID=946362 RepID=F2UNR4_SALR5|nr:uncharacterized protein PTSG_09687 [Salpingoeca rosetta]EGD79269.1 hypothetical protein PTSG_09687 [Salpingoeca rosetta]|eukprot:XP_004989040.1 hypothetical protein PTSG_09687 [Salpingoeca rosetta]